MAGMDMDHAGDGDLIFIDGMIPHHEGAVAMAQQALGESERPEIRQLAEAIIAAQEAEIQQLQEWRTAWFGDAPSAMDPHAAMHGTMHMTEVPAGDQPFDLRFIDGMIPHHEDAITMAETVLAESERPEIRELAEAIIAAQRAEIEQMQEWRAAWFANE
jgi:uncharacterized protein (DUF305 family)